MSVQVKIMDEIKNAMRSKDTVRLNALRSIKAAFLEKEISVRQGGKAELSDDDMMSVINNLAKKRRDSIEQFKAGHRLDLAEVEEKELAVLMEFLPKQLTKEEVVSRLKEILSEAGATSGKDFGKVMPIAMKEFKGKVDGKIVQDSLKELLGN